MYGFIGFVCDLHMCLTSFVMFVSHFLHVFAKTLILGDSVALPLAKLSIHSSIFF